MGTEVPRATMIAMLPCTDIDETARFWTALGLTITYRQLRPNPYVALERNGINLHYYGLEGVQAEQNHATCGIVVDDTEPLFQLFAAGLTALLGRIPVSGLPRITRPRRRVNNAGLSGFSIVDRDGNWIRVSRRPAHVDEQPKAVDGRVEWASQGGSALARAVENAVVMADSHGDEAQAERMLAGAASRHLDAPAVDRIDALAYLVELRTRLDRADAAAAARTELAEFAERRDVTAEERNRLASALSELEQLGL